MENEEGESTVMEIDDVPVKKKKKNHKESKVKKRNKIESDSAEDQDEEEIYCICRTSDIDRFMIACDKCEEWFHGDCVGVKNKKAARKIEEWYCPNCLKKDDQLEILYKFQKENLSTQVNEKNENNIKENLTSYKDIKDQESMKIKERERQDETASLIVSTETSQSAKSDDRKEGVDISAVIAAMDQFSGSETKATSELKKEAQSDYCKKENDKLKKEDKEKYKRMSRQCGECPACVKKYDCGHCDFCLDMRKFGGQGKLRQKCRTRQCHLLSRVKKKDGLSSSGSKEKLSELLVAEHEYSSSFSSQLYTSGPSVVSDHCYTTRGPSPPVNVISEEPEEQIAEKPDDDDTENVEEEPPAPKKTLKVKRVVTKHELATEARNNKNDRNKKRKVNVKKEKENFKKSKQSSIVSELERLGTSRQTRSSKREKEREKTASPKQCLGPGCVYAARMNSKYCSNECGLQLQMKRLQTFLPLRRHDGNYHANVLAEEKLKQLQETQKKCKEVLLQLDNQYKYLEELIERSKQLTVQQEEQTEEEKDNDIDLTTYCVSCGIALAPRIAYKHMEKCWAKLECLMSFGAVMKSVGNLFCDAYVQGTYCKRLKIMCPEHYKERKVEADEVCGCPLSDSNFRESNEHFCRVAKRKCNQHISWERLRKGEIDLKRVHQWWKLEDAYEQERQIRIEMSQRKNVLALLLNQTIDHSKKQEIKETSLENTSSSDSKEDVDVEGDDENISDLKIGMVENENVPEEKRPLIENNKTMLEMKTNVKEIISKNTDAEKIVNVSDGIIDTVPADEQNLNQLEVRMIEENNTNVIVSENSTHNDERYIIQNTTE